MVARRAFLPFLFLLGATLVVQAQTTAPATEPPVQLDPLTVNAADDAEFDATGMGSLDEQLRDEPFANDLIKPVDTQLDENMATDLGGELAAVAQPSPADRITGEERLNLRGFPTPIMRNGFVQLGISDYLNTARTVVIQGPLVPVLGRAAPGGIQDMQTARPQAKDRQRFDLQFTSLQRQRAQLETTGPLVKKKLWQRLAVDWQRRTGPEQFTREEWISISSALTWRHSRAASTLVSADYREVRAHVTPGIPEYRPVGGLIAGPYLPLAFFNANGPDAAVRRRAAVVGVQFDGAPTKTLALRANAEGWWRDVVQDRFTTSVLSLGTGLFEGTREPRHIEQPQHAFATQLELTNRFKAFGADHKLLASGSHTWGEYGREDRALPTSARDALPLSVRRFNPLAPDYYRPDYDPAVYSRILTNRTEYARYTAFELSDRAAFRRGRYVLSTGVRYDAVSLRVEDRKAGAAFPRVSDRAAQLSYHAGLNWQVKPSRLLAFASLSTAFDPSTRVDARTGRIQDNETTLGYEAGLKGRAAKNGAVEYSSSAFLLYNQHISRRNPLYDDPIFDPNQTQPQLVAAGEERYHGVRAEVRWQVTPAVALSSRLVAMRAITTASPDLPQEIGRAISRLPAFTNYTQLRYRKPGPKGGPFAAGTWQYVSNYVANYADARRTFLKYPGYGLVHASAGYSWRTPKRTFEIEVGTRNLLDRDLVASNARLGAQREFTFSTRVIF